jgi:hypothetical protein
MKPIPRTAHLRAFAKCKGVLGARKGAFANRKGAFANRKGVFVNRKGVFANRKGAFRARKGVFGAGTPVFMKNFPVASSGPGRGSIEGERAGRPDIHAFEAVMERERRRRPSARLLRRLRIHPIRGAGTQHLLSTHRVIRPLTTQQILDKKFLRTM